jgi:hypothetical protein
MRSAPRGDGGAGVGVADREGRVVTGRVVDLRHFLAPSGAIAELPAPARRLAQYFASIVVDATSNLDDPPSVRCRCRPGRKRCEGLVISLPDPEHDDAITWYCPVCGDNGLISGWQGTLWDGFADDVSRVLS